MLLSTGTGQSWPGRWAGRCAACVGVAALVAIGVRPAGAQAGAPRQEVGISATEIRVGVIADVGNPVSPGLEQGPVDAVEGFARYVNASGGIAGRQLVVDVYDSKANPNETRNSIIAACMRDFALVGTAANFVNNVDDLVGCPDSTGRPTGLPDIPVVTTDVVHKCSPVSFPVIAPELDCSTKSEPLQTYRTRQGSTLWLLQHVSRDLHGIFPLPADLQSTKNTVLASDRATESLGIKSDGELDISAVAPQSAYTPLIQVMKTKHSNYARVGIGYTAVVELLREAKLQGLQGVKAWDCPLSCYTPQFLVQGGAAVEGTYVTIFFLPFSEQGYNAELARFLRYTGTAHADTFAAEAWASAVLFRQAVDAIVKRDGATSLTRAALLAQIKATNGFDANGMIGRTDVGAKQVSPCYVLMQVRHGQFVRVHPSQPGTFDCTPSNVRSVKLNLLG